MQTLRAVFLNLPALAGVAVAAGLAALACGLAFDHVRKILLTVLAVALFLHAAVFFNTTLAYVKFPYEGKSVVEGVTLYNSMKYLDGEQPYHPPDRLPFRSLVYPPVHEMALAGWIALFGPSLWAAKFFSLLCALGTATLAGLAVWRATRDRIASIFAGSFFVCCYDVCGQWMEQVRNDALLCFLSLLGLFLAGRALRGKRFPLAALVILVLALYTKQTAVFAALAVCIVLLLQSPRLAVVWACAFGSAAVALFIAMQVWSRGWFSFYIFRVPAGVGLQISNIKLSSVFLCGTWIALGAVLVFAFSALKAVPGREESPSGERLWAVGFLAALFLCFLQSLKWGAALNAFLPVAALMAVLVGFALHRLMRRYEGKRWAQAVVLAATVMQVALLSYGSGIPTEIDRAPQRRISQWVRAAPGDVFVSAFSSQVFLNDKTYFGDTVPIGDLAKGGLWRGGELVEKAERSEFALMILRPHVEPEDLARAVEAEYQPVEKINMPGVIGAWSYMQVYVPKSAPWHPAPAAGANP